MQIPVQINPATSILRESEARHQFIQDKLKVEVSDADIDQRISALAQTVMKS